MHFDPFFIIYLFLYFDLFYIFYFVILSLFNYSIIYFLYYICMIYFICERAAGYLHFSSICVNQGL